MKEYAFEDIIFRETKPITVEKPLIFCGLPDIGLVGVIAISHMVEQLQMEEVGHIDSELFPPIVIFHRGDLKYPIRIYQKNRVIAILSEIAIPVPAVYPISKAITMWAKERGTELLLSIGGVGVPNRLEIETPEVYGASAFPYLREQFKRLGIQMLEEGFLVGPYALILKQSYLLNVPSAIFLAQAFPQYPDPGAAAEILKVINRTFGLDVDVSKLIEKSEEIRLRARELMKRTAAVMKQMGKTQEYELPLMYG